VTWLDLPEDTGFGLANLPYGVFSGRARVRRTCVAIGNDVLDLGGLTEDPVHLTGSLDDLMALGPPAWRELREQVTEWLTDTRHRAAVQAHLLPRDEVMLHLPFSVADYVDFYSSEHHAANLGRILRPGTAPLPAAWRHLPIGYHGRAGTVAVSGTPVVRPCGQRPGTEGVPTFGATERLDIEAEVGFVVGVPTRLGERVPVGAFADHVFGVCLVDDWSARDLQAWEYQPLGPFLGKSFLTSVSPWVVPLPALEAARVRPPERDPLPLDYLRDDDEPWGLDLTLEVRLNGTVVSRPPFASTYWTPAQQLAHLTVNGASLRTGDLFASGTVSGPERDQRGSLIELSEGGTEPLRLADGSTRTFLEDGDVASISATAPATDGGRLCLGEVTGRVEPAR
jgi:fumarylacetoacetase